MRVDISSKLDEVENSIQRKRNDFNQVLHKNPTVLTNSFKHFPNFRPTILSGISRANRSIMTDEDAVPMNQDDGDEITEILISDDGSVTSDHPVWS